MGLALVWMVTSPAERAASGLLTHPSSQSHAVGVLARIVRFVLSRRIRALEGDVLILATPK
ncbi:hypothetical protein [Aeromicrobium sp.]|uniref:hypothetical protein n=1 Tax=Aeromicrobium sp. TaxID=1871063 RepID=UPI0030BA6B7F